MVHALKEAQRVLVSRGVMIDVRPLSLDVPLEVLHEGASESAGMIDLSPDRELDIIADQVIESVTSGGIYRETFKDQFEFPYYWKTIQDMLDDLEEYWKDDVILPKEVLQQARKIWKKRRQQAQLRVGVQMILGRYEKV